ncbi:MAG: tetratricopeptide repeat protein [Spirirestis rafaelensis WJT71-NPBG6]|jgi:CHAT domain-containing protein/Tfp pilus assembly protein PilF|nr:tetratricopeptide repeat protein [Spirirestis rafaelensis WJT71-NPBG6]
MLELAQKILLLCNDKKGTYIFRFSRQKAKTQGCIKLVSWSMTAALALGLLVSIPAEVTGQSQPPSTQHSADLEEAKRLNQQVLQLYNQGKYTEGIPLAERALAIREKVLGKEHPLVAQSLNNLAYLYVEQGSYQKAEPLLVRSLTIDEKALGTEHPDVAIDLNNLASLYVKQGSYQKAELLLVRSLAIREKVLGKEHPLVAQSLNNLASLYVEQGSYEKAEPLYVRSLAIREKVLGKEHPDVASSLNNLASLYREQGSYHKAESLVVRSLAIREKVLGKEHPDVVTSLNNLAELYRVQGSYQKAEPLYLRSLAIREKVLGKEHPDVATSLNNLATLYLEQGSYQKAEPLYLRSLAIYEIVLGKEHPSVASSLNNLAELYSSQGSYEKAEPLYLRSLAIREKVLGKEHPDIANSLNSLAELYREEGSYEKAEPLYVRSLAIYEKVLGKEHPSVAISLNNLAILYQNQGSYEKAEPLFVRSLAIREKVLGKENPSVASSLNNLAELYSSQGSYKKAEPLFVRSLAIREKVLGKEHPDVAQTLNNLAGLYYAQNDITRATDFFSRGLAVEEHNLDLIFAVGSEQRKQNYARTFTGTTDGIISLSLQQATNNPTLAKLTLTTVLRRKGLVLDAVTDNIQTLRSQLASKPETKKLFDDWLNVNQELSALVYKGQGKQSPTEYKAKFQQLEAEKERLEEAITTKSAEFRTATQPVELAAIQTQIPKDAALVEIVRYHPFNPKAKSGEKWGKPRYAAAALRSVGEPKWVDLGDAATIDKSVADLREALKDRRVSVKQLARTLDQQVMAPIRPLLGSARHLLLSPDGQLTLIPFEALKDEQNKYLIQRYTFSYLSSGRDLLRFQLPANSRSNPVVFANIDYDQQEIATASAVRGSENRRSADLADLQFGSLGNTLEEANKIKGIFPDTKIISGKQATEAVIKQLQTPSILHLATHGFFVPDQQPDLIADYFNKQLPNALNLENPLLRSGLALAGINNRTKALSNSNDGVLTALEVAGLNLRGTQLVVLSACETGLGDVKVGDGLYGLRRALVIAGSQSQVLSLWIVSDEATKDLMVKYYQNLKGSKGRHEALREAQMELLKTPGYEHPYYWASFVPSGDWSALKK